MPGIGLVTAVALILATNNFTAFENSRNGATAARPPQPSNQMKN